MVVQTYAGSIEILPGSSNQELDFMSHLPASRRGHYRRGLHGRATNPLSLPYLFASARMLPRFLRDVAMCSPHLATFSHESWL